MSKELPTPTLESERFVIRPLERSDAEALFPTLSDPEQCRFLLRSAFQTVEELGDWLCDPDWNGRSWSAFDRAAGELVARIVTVPEREEQVEIGYITVSHRQGEGVAEECSARLISYLFEDEGAHRVTAGTDPRNAASNRVLEKLGFRREAHHVQSVKTHLGWCDEYFWGLLRSEWEERSLAEMKAAAVRESGRPPGPQVF